MPAGLTIHLLGGVGLGARVRGRVRQCAAGEEEGTVGRVAGPLPASQTAPRWGRVPKIPRGWRLRGLRTLTLRDISLDQARWGAWQGLGLSCRWGGPWSPTVLSDLLETWGPEPVSLMMAQAFQGSLPSLKGQACSSFLVCTPHFLEMWDPGGWAWGASAGH